jgi:hypothetical protein
VLLLGYCIVAEIGCNWYPHHINIFPLSKKYTSKSTEGAIIVFNKLKKIEVDFRATIADSLKMDTAKVA